MDLRQTQKRFSLTFTKFQGPLRQNDVRPPIRKIPVSSLVDLKPTSRDEAALDRAGGAHYLGVRLALPVVLNSLR
ncbi:hypothetical protein NQZ68_034251 [Dissostichus eleginoides]|nr:hypothetical protein NQZ68_034251 [Dissostichus eleginoides]